MERLRSFIKGAFSYPRLLWSTHPVTVAGIISTTVLYATHTFINISRDYSRTQSWEVPLEIFSHICLALLFFTIFALCLECIRPKWSTVVRAVVFAAFGILSFLMSFILSDLITRGHGRYKEWLLRIRTGLGIDTVALYIAGLLAIALLLAVYFSYSHDIHQRFCEHVMNAHAKMFFTSIIYGVIQLGVLFLTLIVVLLLYDDAFEYIVPILILINGLFFCPALICAAIRQNEPANKFMEILVRYVMLTIVVIGFGIIYIYIIKLLVTGNVPSNSVYAIISAVFVVSMIVSYMCTAYEEKGLLQKFAYNAPLVFAPFILMQCYTVFIRIGQYGITPKRYFGLAFIAFEIVYIVYYYLIRKREQEIAGRGILLIMCIFILVTVFMPLLSARSLSNILARHTLRSYIEKSSAGETVSDKEYVRTNAAYGYLKDKEWGEGKLERYFEFLDDETVRSMKDGAIEASKRLSEASRKISSGSDDPFPKDGWFSMELLELAGTDHIDISRYGSLQYVSVLLPENYDINHNTAIDTSKLPVYAYGKNYEINRTTDTPVFTIDLTDYCKRFNELTEQSDRKITDYDESRKQIAKMSIIDINENARLYITSADISRNENGETVRVDISGYLLTK